MVSVDNVYKTVLTLANSDIRGNVTPSEFKLLLHDAVNEIYGEYIQEVNRILNRENRGLVHGGLENLPDRIREKIQYFSKDADLTLNAGVYPLPSDLRFIDAITYEGRTEIESCKNSQEFRMVSKYFHTQPTSNYPIYLQQGNAIKIAPDTIVDEVTITYLRNPLMANWTYVVVNGAELFNPSANDFQDIDLHPSEENNVTVRVLLRFGVNLKENEIQQAVLAKDNLDFNQQNSN
jgi:hypothetical protein